MPSLDIPIRDDFRSRTPSPTPTSAPSRLPAGREREQPRTGHRREHDPSLDKRTGQNRADGALMDVALYRAVSYRDLSEAHFGGHPFTTRKAVDRMIRASLMREHQAQGPKGGAFKVLTVTEAGAREARQLAVKQGFDKEQRTWSGLVKKSELSHDTAVYRAAQVESQRLIEQGARIRRVRIDAELKKHVARATERARAKEGKKAADAARRKAAQELGLPMQQGRVFYPDAQIEYQDSEGHSGRVSVEIASEHYRTGAIAAKAQAGFRMHGNGAHANGVIRKALGMIQRDGSDARNKGGAARGGRDGSVEL